MSRAPAVRALLAAGALGLAAAAAAPATAPAQQLELDTIDVTPLIEEALSAESEEDRGGFVAGTAFGSAEEVVRERVASAPGAILRGLDKMAGEAQDLELDVGESRNFGRLRVTLEDCRSPVNNPAGNAYAYLRIAEPDRERPAFEGWMIAAAPALNALDHPRYDVWVLRCKSS